MNDGKRLEATLCAYHAVIRAEGHEVYQIPDPVHIVETRGQQVIGRLLPARACDFGGWLADGRAVMIDAKHAAGSRFDFDRVAGTQLEVMRRCAAAGGIAGVVLWLGDAGWWLPVSAEGVVAGVRDKASWTPDDGGAVKLTGVRWLVKEVIGE